MKKHVLYGIAIVVLAGSLFLSVLSYQKSQYYKKEAGSAAAGVFDFAKRLHLADDEHPLHFEGGEHPFYEKGSVSSQYYYDTHLLHQRVSIASALIGFSLALALIYYASTKSSPEAEEAV